VRSDRSGRARIVAAVHEPGRHKLTAAKPSCRRGKAALRVLDAS
jgi:hypothetical protein